MNYTECLLISKQGLNTVKQTRHGRQMYWQRFIQDV